MFISAFSYTLQCLSVDPAQRIRRPKHSLTSNTFTSARIMPLLASSMGEEHPGPDGRRPQADPRRAGLVPQAGSTTHSAAARLRDIISLLLFGLERSPLQDALADDFPLWKAAFPNARGTPTLPPRELAVEGALASKGGKWPFPTPVRARPPRELTVERRGILPVGGRSTLASSSSSDRASVERPPPDLRVVTRR